MVEAGGKYYDIGEVNGGRGNTSKLSSELLTLLFNLSPNIAHLSG